MLKAVQGLVRSAGMREKSGQSLEPDRTSALVGKRPRRGVSVLTEDIAHRRAGCVTATEAWKRFAAGRYGISPSQPVVPRPACRRRSTYRCWPHT